jgi:hypothetical protein
MFKSNKQPLCRACGKPIAKYTTTAYVVPELDERYHRNNSYSRYIYANPPLVSKADCQRVSNQQVMSIKYTIDTDAHFEPIPGSRHVHLFTEWDGESYTDEFFCSGACAQDFGRMAARSGKIQSVAYVDAIKRRKLMESAE